MKYPLQVIDNWADGWSEMYLKDEVLVLFGRVWWGHEQNPEVSVHPANIAQIPGGLFDEFQLKPQPLMPVLYPSELATIFRTVRTCQDEGRKKKPRQFTFRSEEVEKIKSGPSVLLQAVVVPGESTEHGVLVDAIAIPWLEIVKLLNEDPSLAFKIDPRKWEEIIAGAYKKAGFDEVTLTPRSGDYGRDIIAVKRGIGTIRVLDQVKAYKPGHLVSANDVRALYGVVEADRAQKGFLTTTSDFAPRLKDDPLMRRVIPDRVELINGTMLLKRLKELAEKK